DDVVLLRVERVRIRAALEQRLRGGLMAKMRGDMQWRAAMAVDPIDLVARGDQPCDLRRVASRGGGMQPAIGRDLRGAGRDLRRRGQCEEQGDDQQKEPHLASFGLGMILFENRYPLFGIMPTKKKVPAGKPGRSVWGHLGWGMGIIPRW